MVKHTYVGDFVVYRRIGMQNRLLEVSAVTPKTITAGGHKFCRLSGNRIYTFPVPIDMVARIRKADAKDIATARINKAQEALLNYKVGETNLEQVEQFLRGSL